ncbi:MAG: fructose-bisphosphate aldolase class I [Candidatus Andersenbacteria bacterium]|nr:fructose-bisphosphate aldolase class I [Candidatus Andersenbacteria bacterium]MBI3250917.1 fructose-bisphosphate aldolase class I [Candidatus Andersenbacteria bacterium]
MNNLHEIARDLAVPGKGILAADESLKTAKKRLESVGAEDNEENRRMYRELFFTADGIGDYLSGVILFDETFWQKSSDGTPFVKLLESKGVMPGIKVDMSTAPMPNFPGEEFTQGFDGLAQRLEKYVEGGAKFTKWRNVIRIGDTMPSDMNLREMAIGMAHYAAAVQAVGMVPMVEPEVLLEGSHTIEQAEEVTTKTLQRMFEEIKNYNVDVAGLVLKSSMVLAGDKAPKQSTPEEVAEATLRTFEASVPEEVPSIVFLSGGQTTQQATDNLQVIAQKNNGPWQISFSYARALQGPSLTIWAGKSENIPAAQEKFIERLKETAAARDGK